MSASRFKTRWCIAVLVTAGFLGAGTAFSARQGPDWPQFHGPNRNNISDETRLLKAWPEGGPKLLWTAQGLGHGFSSLAVAGGKIYTAGNIKEDTILTALGLDGKKLWQVKNGPAWTRDYPGTRATPTLDGDRLYHQSPLGNIVCLQAQTGAPLWQLNVLEKFGSEPPRWGLAESLLIDGDHLICCPGGPQTCMVALDERTGAVIWEAPSTGEAAGYASAILAECDGMRIVIALTAKALIGVNADTGALLWHAEHESYADENILMPIYHEGHVFVSTLKTGSVKWKINVRGGKASLEEQWRTDELDNHHGGVLLLDGYLYGTSTFRNRDHWVCLDWEKGAIQFVDKAVGKSSLTYADGLLYTLSIDRLMGLVHPTPTGLEVISSFMIPEGGEGKSWAHPVVCGGRLYVRHGQFLYAYNIGAEN